MLQHVLSLCEKDTSIASVYLHVQTTNDDAVECVVEDGKQSRRTESAFFYGSTSTPQVLQKAGLYHF